ncbi:RDD family protein [Tepidanaerobacter sp. GT38]|uniref:RDD family protein n=1 Tax=Tepidanaerobacter sp. GT38 TaxID=2722793 RepID=UPI00351CE0A0
MYCKTNIFNYGKIVYKKAGLIERIIAALIDGIIASILIYVPILGGIAGTIYILTKDAIAFEITKNPDYKNRSIGKKIMGIEVVNFDGQDVDWIVSLKRNIPLAIGNVIAIVPVIGWANSSFRRWL